MHNGKLSHDSPSLAQNLRRYLKPDEVSFIELSYELSCQYGGLSEVKFERDRTMSFNPRPARVAQILINEIRCHDAKVLACAILGCARCEELQNLPDKFSNIQIDFSVLRNLLLGVNQFPENPSSESSFLAIALDRARHVHMIKDSPQLLREEFQELKSLLNYEKKYEENGRLHLMLDSALLKLQAIVDAYE